MRCIFHVLAAGGAFTVRAGSQSTRKKKKKTDLGQILTHTHQLYREGEMGESRVKGQRGERGGNDRGGREGEEAGRKGVGDR